VSVLLGKFVPRALGHPFRGFHEESVWQRRSCLLATEVKRLLQRKRRVNQGLSWESLHSTHAEPSKLPRSEDVLKGGGGSNPALVVFGGANCPCGEGGTAVC